MVKSANEELLKPSEVFARRLAEWREERGWTQRQLAEALTSAGVPMRRESINRIESGAQKVKFDEAFAIAAELNVALAYLLAPPEGTMLELQGKIAVDAPAFYRFLTRGFPWTLDALPSEYAESGKEEHFERVLVVLAGALKNAAIAKDAVAVTELRNLIALEVQRYEGDDTG